MTSYVADGVERAARVREAEAVIAASFEFASTTGDFDPESTRVHVRAEELLSALPKAEGRPPKSYTADEYVAACNVVMAASAETEPLPEASAGAPALRKHPDRHVEDRVQRLFRERHLEDHESGVMPQSTHDALVPIAEAELAQEARQGYPNVGGAS